MPLGALHSEGPECIGGRIFGIGTVSLFGTIGTVQWMDSIVDRSVSLTNQDCDPQ
ncbi:hypothetical protein NicSoilC5_16740 [Arthrobacter sp. NicSoilC5]|nr:hypothetical protein NicSoilC5_16740 [Arthrobacter sp. NicSoilC5]